MSLTIDLLLTGSELMSGDIIDSNSSYISEKLLNEGYVTSKKVTVGDQLPDLTRELTQLSNSADILIVNGGLGPTVDDLTAEALAKATQQALVEHADAIKHLEQWCLQRSFTLNGPNRKQAILPEQVDIIPNSVGSAVGFHLFWKGCHIYCTPGVPSELKKMLNESIIPHILKTFPNESETRVSHFYVFGLGESYLQKLINDELKDWPTDIDIGFRASMPLVEVKLTTQNADSHALKEKWEQRLRALLGAHVLEGYPSSMPNEVVQLLSRKALTLTTAESCTGGLISSQITEIPGASKMFEGSFISYSNAMKMTLLDVNSETLAHHGAVSERVVIEMLKGALKKSNADLGIAVSGIAGPEGGTEDKPVGTVWIAWGSLNNTHTQCLYLPGARAYFQQFVAAAALDLIRREVMGISETPIWFKRTQPKGKRK